MAINILWVSLGICVIVGFVLYVLIAHWRGVIAFHARSIWRLSERLRALEEMENPDFRQRIERVTPMPLQRVCTFVFHLTDQFWHKTLGATPGELAFVKAHGSFLGSVKIEQWRSHSVVTLYEVLWRSQTGDWQIRSIDVYPAEKGDGSPVTLWELPLGVHREGSLELPPELELRLEDSRLQLCALYGRFGCEYFEDGRVTPKPENVFLELALAAPYLEQFRKKDDPEESAALLDARQKFAGVVYAHTDEQHGVEWRLYVRDLQARRNSPEWKTWDILPGREVS